MYSNFDISIPSIHFVRALIRLDRKLAEKGVSMEQQESLWLCEECKKEATIEEFRKEIEKSLGLQPS
ncbi:hypothetical protein [Thermofilum sp.]|uniref:hypothetical protein n=1 Tax=Thermofilum sp. TaxID=1961369 RepID=UPI00258763F5|nr:hypothetical protein [Thermofilum sp.]